VRELVIISGKGGTGKTSIAGSFAALAENAVLADCDVDAANLHLLLEPRVRKTGVYMAGKEAVIRQDECLRCGACFAYCRFDAVERIPEDDGSYSYRINEVSCEGCGVCVEFCPIRIIDFTDRACGEWFISDTRFGPMVHAKLGVGAENSGKLVGLVRERAREVADTEQRDLILVDGAPGIGCPVIASVTGASLVLVVTEPTLSGLHDLDRVLELAAHFGLPAAVCINKSSLNEDMAAAIEDRCTQRGVPIAGRVPYDAGVTAALLEGRTVVEHGSGPAAAAIRDLWDYVQACLDGVLECEPVKQV